MGRGFRVLVALAAALVVMFSIGDAHARPQRQTAPLAARGPSTARARLIAEVRRGLDLAAARWGWKGWFVKRRGTARWAPIWDSVHLLSAATGLAAASGRADDKLRAADLARRAEGYWNPRLAGGIGGFSTQFATQGDSSPNWFDDNGWLGLAFFSAYEQTGDPAFLRDARRALTYINRAGWDKRDGGIWWSTEHGFKAGESVVTAALLAVRLYHATGDPAHLMAARRLIDWANVHLFDFDAGLYVNRPDGAPISYLQSPMIDAMARLCRSRQLYCDRLQFLVEASLRRYGGTLTHAPKYDGMYLRFLVDAHEVLHDKRLLRVVFHNALRAEKLAAVGDGFFTHDWSGSNQETEAGSLQTHAATLQALAWAAVVLP